MMDIIYRIDKLLGDQMTAGSGATTTANVATNLAKGHVDVIGGACPPGQVYDTKKKVCVPKKKNEASVVGGSYIGGTTVNIIGSGQTRTWGVKKGDTARGGTRGEMPDLNRKNKGEIISADKTVENLGRKGLKFNHVLGAYVPDFWTEE